MIKDWPLWTQWASAIVLASCGARSDLDLLEGSGGHAISTVPANPDGAGGTTSTTATDASSGATCEADCTTKLCGQDDGCGSTCTNCPLNQTCDTSTWQCVDNGLVAYYPCDGDAHDASGNGNDGTIYGATFGAGHLGKPSSACQFDGIDDWIDVLDSPSLDTIEANQALTTAAWIRVDGWYQDWNIFAVVEKVDESDDQGWELVVGAQPSVVLGFSFQLWVTSSAPWSVTFGQWRHVAVVYDAASASVDFYSDGLLLQHATAAGRLIGTGAGHLHIGKSVVGPDEFSVGAIDELRIFNRALSAGEIWSLFAAP